MNLKKIAIGGMIVGAAIAAYGASNVNHLKKLNSTEGYSRYQENRVKIAGIEDRIRGYESDSRNLSQFILGTPMREPFNLLEQAYIEKKEAMLTDSSYLNLLQRNSAYKKSAEYKKITDENTKTIMSLVGGLYLIISSGLLYYNNKNKILLIRNY